jgi:uncharacterized protein
MLRAGLGAGLGLGSALLLNPASVQAQDMRYFQIGTGTTGGTYFQIGGLLANIISNPPGSLDCDRGGSCGVPGLIAVAQASSGAVENVQSMRAGRLESALTQADIVHAAATADGVFENDPPLTGLRTIANLYSESIHLVVRVDSGIRGIADLKGRRVGLGEEGSGTLVTARLLLSSFGLKEQQIQPLFISPGKGGDRLAAGMVDAFFIVGGAPLPAIADLATRIPISLLPLGGTDLERLSKRLPFYRPTQIEAGTYAGIPATPTLSVGAQWVVLDSSPETLIYAIVKALWTRSSRAILDQGHPRASVIRLETALTGLAVPLHRGAARFYREAGLDVDATPSTVPVKAPAPAKAVDRKPDAKSPSRPPTDKPAKS